MAARIAVFKTASPILPTVANAVTIDDGVERLWLTVDTWREYRHPNGNPIILEKLASVTIATVTYVLVIIWALGNTRDAIDTTLYPGVLAAIVASGDLVANWVTNFDGNFLLTAALDADVGVAATQVKLVWPASWLTPIAATPSAARCIGNVIA